jgi:cysteinyl-tRNA synthetase
MSLRFFNTLTREAEEFRPQDPDRVRMYTCGPTVYNHAHIGNFRAYVFEDLLQRHLEFRGCKVERVMNLTDVDDKTIRGCRAEGVPLAEFTQRYKKAFFEDLEELRIRRDGKFPEATAPEHIARMIEMISTLIERGNAYRAEDGSVYFRIGSFPAYGRLAHFNLEELKPSGRVNSDEYEKEQIGDFALWKAWTEADGEVGWESPWGRGRPGWHIECSAMATGLLGAQIDIHCGGEDNMRDRTALRTVVDALQTPAGGWKKDGEERGQFFHAARLEGQGLVWTGSAICLAGGEISRTAEFHL